MLGTIVGLGLSVAGGYLKGGKSKAKDVAIDKGLEIAAKEMVAVTPAHDVNMPDAGGPDPLDQLGNSLGLRLSGILKRMGLGWSEDYIRDRIRRFGNAIAVGVDLDD